MSEDGLFWVYRMALGTDRVVVGLNLSDSPQTATIENAGSKVVDGLTGDPVVTTTDRVVEMRVAPYAVTILIEEN
jgi:hypothetical protein